MGAATRRPARDPALSGASAPGVAPGTLVVVATPIGNLEDLSPRAASTLAAADVICAEDTRHTGRLLAHLGIANPRLVSLHAHNEASRLQEVLGLLARGSLVALCSDAGTPLVSDPGARLVAAALEAGVEVRAVPGASALLAALVVSGFAGRFVFEGFLPRSGAERAARLEAIVASPMISVLYEAPGRVRATLAELSSRCGRERQVAIARELTKLHEEVVRSSLGEAEGAPMVLQPRGEYVIVVGPADAAPVSREESEEMLRALVAGKMSTRDAARAVEILQHVSHRAAYDAALRIEVELSGGEPGRGGPGA